MGVMWLDKKYIVLKILTGQLQNTVAAAPVTCGAMSKWLMENPAQANPPHPNEREMQTTTAKENHTSMYSSTQKKTQKPKNGQA